QSTTCFKDKGVIDSGCSRHMTGNISYLSDFQELNDGYVAFGGNSKGGKITCKGKIKTASQTNNKHGLGYLSLEDDSKSVSLTCLSDRLSPSGGYYDVPPPITGNFMPPKPDLVFNTAPFAVESDHSAFNVQTTEHVKTPRHSIQPVEVPILAATPKPTCPKTSSSVPAAVLSKSKPVSVTAVRPVSAVVPKIMKSRPNYAHTIDTKSKSTTRKHKTRGHFSKTSNSSSRVTKGKQGKWVWKPKCPILDHASRTKGQSTTCFKDKGVINSGCSRYMTGNISYLSDFQELNDGYVAFGGNSKGGKITCKGKIKTDKLDFEDVYFVKELKFNIFSFSQMYDKKKKFLFTDSECLVLSLDFKLLDENQVLLRVPRENNMKAA
nr:ribonuclease H-like domain-containing protein [Tanacetum cinerariifolium]